MRWLLVKDLQILRRSPLLLVLLVAYPLVVGVLIGFAISRTPSEPRVAFLSEVPEDQPFRVGNTRFDILDARNELFSRLDIVRVDSRAEARRLVKDGDVLGALILPRDLVDRLQTQGLSRPRVEVMVNEDDPVKARFVNDRIDALLSEANLRLSKTFSDVTLQFLRLLLDGGQFDFLGRTLDVLGLKQSEQILQAIRRELPRKGPERPALDRVIRFAGFAQRNSRFADDLVGSVAQPIGVTKTKVAGDSPALDSFAVAVAAAVTLMFVTVLLVSGSMALEREENAYTRLVRGLVSRTALLAEKVLLGALCSVVVALLLLAGLVPFVSLDLGRSPLWLPALILGALAFGALGAAIGALAKDVRAGSLLAFMVAIPVAFISLIPSGAVGPAVFDVVRAIAALFPFRAAVTALSAAFDDSGPALAPPLLHLAALIAGWSALSRLGMRRFAR